MGRVRSVRRAAGFRLVCLREASLREGAAIGAGIVGLLTSEITKKKALLPIAGESAEAVLVADEVDSNLGPPAVRGSGP